MPCPALTTPFLYFVFCFLNNPNHSFLWLTSLNVFLFTVWRCVQVYPTVRAAITSPPPFLPDRKPKEGRGVSCSCSVLLGSNNVSLGGEAESVRRHLIRSRRSKRWWEDHSRLVGQQQGEREVGLSVTTLVMFLDDMSAILQVIPSF